MTNTKEYNKLYYEKNKAKMIAQISKNNAIKINCPVCSLSVRKSGFKRHKASKTHMLNVNMKKEAELKKLDEEDTRQQIKEIKELLTYRELWKDIAEKREKEFGEFLKTATLDDAVKSKYFN
jgi:hypothetical protein